MEKAITRREQYLQAIASRHMELLPDTPLTREEVLLAEIAQKADGAGGKDGVDGKSAYETAVENGYEGTETELGESLAAIADMNMTQAQMLNILNGGNV